MVLWYEIWHEVMFWTLIIIIYLLRAAFVRADNSAVTEPGNILHSFIFCIHFEAKLLVFCDVVFTFANSDIED